MSDIKIPDLPEGPEDIKQSEAKLPKAFIMNPYFQKELLTKTEALNLLNHITGVLLIHECNR
jgi:hypothetical protein